MFAEEIGERPGHQKKFNGRMEKKGFKQERDERGSWFKGLVSKHSTFGKGQGSPENY
jgi:hypothetical protein